MPGPGEPRALFVGGLYSLDATETRRRLALVMAAVKAADIEAGGDGALRGTLHRVEALLLSTARQSVKDLAQALAAHEAKKAAPHEPEPAAPLPPPPLPQGIRLPRLPLRHAPRTP